GARCPVFFFAAAAPARTFPLSLHDALPIWVLSSDALPQEYLTSDKKRLVVDHVTRWRISDPLAFFKAVRTEAGARARLDDIIFSDRKSTRLNSSHVKISYAVFCLKKKNKSS